MSKKIFIFLLLLFLIMSTGCWNSRELESLGYVMAMAIDRNGAGEVECAFAVSKPSAASGGSVSGKSGGGLGLERVVFRGTGRTVFEAIRNVLMESPRKLFFGQDMVVIITERAAEVGDVSGILDMELRDHEFRRLTKILVTKSDALTVIDAQPEFEDSFAKELNDIVEKSDSIGKFPQIDLNDFAGVLASDVPNPVAPLVVIKDGIWQKKFYEEQSKQAPKTFFLQGMAVFKGAHFLSEIDTIGTRGWMWTQNKINSAIIVINAPSKTSKPVSMEVFSSKADLSSRLKNGVPEIKVKIDVEVNLGEEMDNEDLTKADKIKALEKRTAAAIKAEVDKAVYQGQKQLKLDYFGFGEVVHRSNKEYWHTHKNQWEKIFPQTKITSLVKVKMRRMGLQTKPIMAK